MPVGHSDATKSTFLKQICKNKKYRANGLSPTGFVGDCCDKRRIKPISKCSLVSWDNDASGLDDYFKNLDRSIIGSNNVTEMIKILGKYYIRRFSDMMTNNNHHISHENPLSQAHHSTARVCPLSTQTLCRQCKLNVSRSCGYQSNVEPIEELFAAFDIPWFSILKTANDDVEKNKLLNNILENWNLLDEIDAFTPNITSYYIP